jgi:hypothetical protein
MDLSGSVTLALYLLGLFVFLASVVYFLVLARRRRGKPIEEGLKLKRLEPVAELVSAGEATKSTQVVQLARIVGFPSEVGVKETRVAELAMDVNIALLKATRGQERTLSKARAEELLRLLRDELAIPPKDASPTELVQSIRGRLITLTEMMAEAQVSICDLDHRVVDIETLTAQLPAVVKDHRRHIASLHQSIEELREKSSKSDIQQIEKELTAVKWVFTVALGIILAILGALLRKLI